MVPLFCPFGLVGWAAKKVSIFKIKVDYDKCTSCEVCSKACPVKAISFEAGKREMPPEGKFVKE